MAFKEYRLLDRIAFGATGGPAFSTEIVTVRSGAESRVQQWAEARHRYDVGLAPRVLSEFEVIKSAFMVCQGRSDGFRYWDRTDYTVAYAESALQALSSGVYVGTAGIGYGVAGYQMRKIYSAGSSVQLRTIRKPVSGTVTVRRGGTPVTAGGGAGQYAVSLTTGIVTFNPDQSKAISSHTVGADHVLTLASAFSPNVAVGGRVYISGVTGTAADVLNGLSHQVTAVAAAVVDIATSTVGLTASGGTAYFYPQPTEAIDFQCEFDVPVRFDVDQFDAVILDRNGGTGELILQLPSVPLVELPENE